MARRPRLAATPAAQPERRLRAEAQPRPSARAARGAAPARSPPAHSPVQVGRAAGREPRRSRRGGRGRRPSRRRCRRRSRAPLPVVTGKVHGRYREGTGKVQGRYGGGAAPHFLDDQEQGGAVDHPELCGCAARRRVSYGEQLRHVDAEERVGREQLDQGQIGVPQQQLRLHLGKARLARLRRRGQVPAAGGRWAMESESGRAAPQQ